eukprot:Opistho-2@36817
MAQLYVSALLGNASSDTDVWCPSNLQWMDHYFGQCCTSYANVAGFFIGLSSIGFWLIAQGPQIYLNFKNGNVESLAFLFLLQWLLGDITNLVGAFLTHQLPTQIYTAVYFCSIDAVMVTQYIYYQYRNRNDRYSAINDDYASEGKVRSLSIAGKRSLHAVLFVGVSAASFAGITLRSMEADTTAHVGRRLLSQSTFSNTSNLIGYILGCISAVLYLCSRVPQIIKNFRRKSTEGLALTMFFMALLGNTTYAISVFLCPCGSLTLSYLVDKFPWLVGSMGTLCFDFTIFVQFWLYRKNKGGNVEEHAHLLADGNDGAEVQYSADKYAGYGSTQELRL